jgi:hypothetical protein
MRSLVTVTFCVVVFGFICYAYADYKRMDRAIRQIAW